jgi:SAM-dependent methyltransferase
MHSETERLYKSERAGVRPSFGSDRDTALAYYARFVDFVTRVATPCGGARRTSLLEVGCGSGWSTHALSVAGFEATGIDLNARGFEVASGDHLLLREGSALDVPFPDESFDVVVSYQVIEHIPAPERALQEMGRVCRRGGVVCIVGPNLLSPLFSIRYLLTFSSWKRMAYKRKPGMPFHPYGNTLWEILSLIPVRTAQLTAKLLSRTPRFTMRIPDTVPPFHGDNDASYLCNPTDLIAWFKKAGWRLLRRGRHGRLPLSYLAAGGTWVAARKAAPVEELQPPWIHGRK